MRYAFAVSVSEAYMFGLNCTINAAKYFGTDADFHIIHDDISESKRNAYNKRFPFNVYWYDIHDVMKEIVVTATKHAPNQFWVSPWYLASKLLDEYDSVCVLQADEFLMANVNGLFRATAMSDVLIATEYTIVRTEVEDLPFGTVKSILHRGHYALFDQLVFCGKANKQIFIDTYQSQCRDRDPEDSEVDQPMCGLNQAVATHLSTDRVIGLDAHVWAWDRDDTIFLLDYDTSTKRLYNERKVRVHGIHTKVWFDGVVSYAVNAHKLGGEKDKVRALCHNFNLERDVMMEFNNMTPATKARCTLEKWENE
jgi:hypothetical protein